MNKVVLITGASRGIGKALAIRFARGGYDVVINYCGNEEKANEVKEECLKFNHEVMVIKGDVSHVEHANEMVKAVLERFGHIDVLINNAGITKDQLFLKMKDQDFYDVLNVNVNGTYHMIKAATRCMFKQKAGVIINMASVIGLVGNIGQANYAASKAGIIGLSKSLAKEFASRHIRVNAIAPGFIQTDMTDLLSEQAKNQILSQIPLNEFGEADDVANLAYFLASDEAKYITGQVIHVDGGMVV